MLDPIEMEKVMCLTDIFEEEVDVIHYAAQLAKDMEAELTLFHVNVVPVHAGPWETTGNLTKSGNITKELANVAERVRKEYGIPCRYEVKEGKQLTNTTIEEGDDLPYDLIVKGTSGSSDVTEKLFGSNTYHVLGVSQKPVLVVPYGVEYQGIKRLVYATDEEEADIEGLAHLRPLIDDLRPDVTLLHVLNSLEPESEATYFFIRKVKFLLNLDDIQYVELVGKNVAEMIEKRSREMGADVVALSSKARQFPGALFHRSVTEDLRRIADHPFLVLHKGLEMEEGPRFFDIELKRGAPSSGPYAFQENEREVLVLERFVRGQDALRCDLILEDGQGRRESVSGSTEPISRVERNGKTSFGLELNDTDQLHASSSVRLLIAVQ